jgi:GNAT superfamily N-acetyltransferase
MRPHPLPEPARLEPLRTTHLHGAAAALADAFSDDPGWLSIGPHEPRRRQKFIHRTCLSTLKVAEHWAGPSWCITEDEEPIGVLAGCAPERWPLPSVRTLFRLAPGPVLAGPAVLARALGAQRVFERGYPEHDAFVVVIFGIKRAHQRRGLGRRLMTEALARADEDQVPAFLWTSNPDNLPYYRSHGYEVVGDETTIPGGASNWFMERPMSAS